MLWHLYICYSWPDGRTKLADSFRGNPWGTPGGGNRLIFSLNSTGNAGTSDKIIILDQAQVNDGSNYEYPGQTPITPVSEEIKEY